LRRQRRQQRPKGVGAPPLVMGRCLPQSHPPPWLPATGPRQWRQQQGRRQRRRDHRRHPALGPVRRWGACRVVPRRRTCHPRGCGCGGGCGRSEVPLGGEAGVNHCLTRPNWIAWDPAYFFSFSSMKLFWRRWDYRRRAGCADVHSAPARAHRWLAQAADQCDGISRPVGAVLNAGRRTQDGKKRLKCLHSGTVYSVP
jgi:hypothetical protein